jgi:hypothetical protein
MKFSCALLALCVFHPTVWGTAAFSMQGPNARTVKGSLHMSTYSDSLSRGSSTSPLENANVSGKVNGANNQNVQNNQSNQNVRTNQNGQINQNGQTFQNAARNQNGPSYQSGPSFQSVSSYQNGATSNMNGAARTTDAYVSRTVNPKLTKNIWDTASTVTVQGGSLKTYSFKSDNVKLVQVALKTEGRPLNANVDLWQGPDNTPQKMGIYIEDGCMRPFSAVIATPRGQNSVAIRNTGQMEFPLDACIEADMSNGYAAAIQNLSDSTRPETVQGGSLKTYSFDSSVESVQILLKTDGRPMNARIELLQGPNNNKQVIELYIEDGMERPFFAVIETPGVGNVVKVVNTAPIEFPMTARVEPYRIQAPSDVARGGWSNDDSAGGWDSKPFSGR